MVVKKRIVPASIGSLDTGVDAKLNEQGLTRLVNASYRRRGAISRRYGENVTSSDGYDGYLAAYKERAISWKEQIAPWDGDAFQDSGRANDLALLDVETQRVSSIAGTAMIWADMDERDNIRAIAWIGTDIEGDTHYYVTTYRIDSGLRMDHQSLGLTATFTAMRVVATSTNLLYFFVDTDSDLRVGQIDTSTGRISVASKINTTWPTVEGVIDKVFDAVAIGEDSTMVALGWATDDGIHDGYAVFATTTAAGVADSYGVVELEDCQQATVSAAGDEELFLGTYWDSYDSGTKFYIGATLYNSSANVRMNEVVLKYWTNSNQVPSDMSAVRLEDNIFQVFFDWDDSTYTYPEWTDSIRRAIFEFHLEGRGTLQEEQIYHQGVSIAVRPWEDPDVEGRVRLVVFPPMALPGDLAQYQYLVIGDEGGDGTIRYWGRLLLGEAFPLGSPRPILKTVEGEAVVRALQCAYFTDDTQGMFVMDIRTKPGYRWMTAVETLDHLVFPGSVSHVWDGQDRVEQGFLLYPPRISTEQVAGTGTYGGLEAPSTYGYVATYEWYDSRGNKWESAPSPVVSHITNTGFQTVKIRVPTLTCTNKDDVAIAIYRTDSYGTTYRRIGIDKQENSPYAAYEEIEDSITDSSLADEPLLYSQPPGGGGPSVLENIAPPPTRIAAVHQNRVFVVNRERESTEIQYSRENQRRQGINHSDFLTIGVPAADGGVTAIKSFLDRLVIFKRNSIYQCYGNGLDAVGRGQGYTEPSLVHPSIGCTSQKTVVEIPQGLMFLASDDQIYLLDRSMNVQPVGDPVQWQTRENRVLSGTPMPEQNAALFVSEDGYGLVYDWEFGSWSTWSEWSGTDCVTAKERPDAQRGATGSHEVPWVARPAGTVAHITDGSYVIKTDGVQSSGPPSLSVTTGWYSFAGVGGFARFKRALILGQMAGAHTLRVRIGYDFDPYWTDELLYDADDILPVFGYASYFDEGSYGSSYEDGAYVLEVSGSRQKVTAVRFRIEEVSPSGAGFELNALSFEVGVKDGPFRTGDDRRRPAD